MKWTKTVLVVANVTAASDELLNALKEQAQREPTKSRGPYCVWR